MTHSVLLGVTFGVLTITACAPLNEQEIAEHQYRRGDYKARFLDYQEQCIAAGGTIVIHSRKRLRPDRIPMPGDRYACHRD